MISLRYWVSAAVALGIIGISAAGAAPPEPVDLGSLTERASEQPISVTIALKLKDLAGAEAMMRQVATPGDPLYHQFLTPKQIQAQFGPSEATVASVIAQLHGRGLSVERMTATTLKATGAPLALERLFQTGLHQFRLPATEATPASTFRAPIGQPVVPAEIAQAVGAVAGLSTKPVFRSHFRHAPTRLGNQPIKRQVIPGAAPTVSQPGRLTVTDFAARYNVDPLYNQGITGKGGTLGIVTFANFTPDDVFAYWGTLNLNVDPNRLTVVNIDDGPGPPSDVSGSSETTLDVEQSGGIAPGANIIVYQAPNTDQGFLDAFAAAIQSNKADSISTSWGNWEWFNSEFPTVTDPFSGQLVSLARAAHELFVVAALQGQSLFAASGDFGAFDSFEFLPPPSFSYPLSVDYPAADMAITAGGGTTLPGTQTFVLPTITLSVNIPTERVWGWDYLQPLCTALQLDPISCGIFPIGSGGGVSVFSPIPFYQTLTAGVQTSQPGQALIEEDTTPPGTIFLLPTHFRGRDVPDVSFNADPDTGYTVFYTSDVHGFEVQTFAGGTSFVAPQLNGVTALLVQNAGHRLGFLNPLLYGLALLGSVHGPNGVLNSISSGDNWFYAGRNGYSPAAGLGVINVSNLAKITK
jgi:subtilase family serine protease